MSAAARPESPPAILARLAALDTCAVSDAMDALGLDGVVAGMRSLGAPKRVAGRARTVRVEPVSAEGGTGVHLGARALTRAAAGDVIVVANDARSEMGAWGGLLSLAASRRGVAGVVVDGAIRDADEARGYGLAVHACGTTPRTARGRITETATDEPVVIGGITVEPGDWVLADGTGVVRIPAAHAERVLAAAEEVARREQAMATALYADVPITEVLGARYETLLDSL